MPDRPNILIAAMGHGGIAPLIAKLDCGLRTRGFESLVWAMGGGDCGLEQLRAEGLAAYAPLRDRQILHFLDTLPEVGFPPDHPRMEFYRAFERGASRETRIGEEGLALIARWGMYIRGRAEELIDRLSPAALLVQSGVRLVEGTLAELASERGIPLLFFDKGAFAETILVDDRGAGPLSLYGDAMRWAAKAPGPLDEEGETLLEQFRRRFQAERRSAWEQPGCQKIALRKRLGLAPDRRILFLPGQVRHDANTVLYSPRFGSNEDFLRFMLDACEGSDLFILAKPHPKGEKKPPRLAKRLEGRGTWMPELNVHDALEEADVVACLNSTVGLEALLYGRPVIAGAHAIWAGKGASFDLLDDLPPESLRAFLDEIPSPDPVRLNPFLHHLLTRGSYGEPPGPWPGMDALAERLCASALDREGDAESGRAWMAAIEAASLCREMERPAHDEWRGLLPLFE